MQEIMAVAAVLLALAVPSRAQTSVLFSPEGAMREAAILINKGPRSVAAVASRGIEAVVEEAVQPVLGSSRAPAVVVGVLDPSGSRVFGFGETFPGSGAAPGGDTFFEIGSITKVFTGLLLADMAEREMIILDEPVRGLLPAGVRVPAGRREITLRDLAAHISGLPRLWDGFNPSDPANPYSDYTAAKLYADLTAHRLAREPGDRIEYSNVGMGLLGDALALKAGKSYEALVLERVCGPLGLNDTRIALSAADRARLTPGHDNGKAVSGWDFASLAGAGAFRSTVKDFLIFLEAQARPSGPLTAAIRLSQRSHSGQAAPSEGISEVGLGWIVLRVGGRTVYFHNGGTGGYRSATAFIPGSGKAVVVLANAGLNDDSVDMAALRILLAL